MNEGARVIAGRYRLTEPLGTGAMGAVWRAHDSTLRSWVAVKLMDPAIAASSSGLQRFLREARAAASIRSPHVIQVLDHGVDDGTPYIVMELLQGETLGTRLEREGVLTPPTTAAFVRQIARALSRAHAAGIVHRDLKPDNVFLIENDDEWVVKVLDFGIAKVTGRSMAHSLQSESTASGAVLGTPYYLSPEQAEGLKSVDYRTDIWALGVLAFECLLGRRPFEAGTLPALFISICRDPLPIPSRLGFVPRGFDAWFATACAREPELRFASAKLAAEELVMVCQGAFRAPRLSPEDAASADEEAPTELWTGSALERVTAGEDAKREWRSGSGATPGNVARRSKWRTHAAWLLPLTFAASVGLWSVSKEVPLTSAVTRGAAQASATVTGQSSLVPSSARPGATTQPTTATSGSLLPPPLAVSALPLEPAPLAPSRSIERSARAPSASPATSAPPSDAPALVSDSEEILRNPYR